MRASALMEGVRERDQRRAADISLCMRNEEGPGMKEMKDEVQVPPCGGHYVV